MEDTTLAPSITVRPSQVVEGINVYERSDYNNWFEQEYTSSVEPWQYSHRGAELYRHLYSTEKIRQYNKRPDTLLELGCSKGLMTEKLISFSHTVYASDISFSALKACKQLCASKAKQEGCQLDYFVATVPYLPFAVNYFDVVSVCDGLEGWSLDDNEKQLALKDIHKVLKPGGIAILTDYLMPDRNRGEFDAYIAMVRNSPLSIVEITFLYDRPWYMLESLLKKTGLRNSMKSVLASISLAKMLNKLGKFIGRKAARHIVIMVRKD